ncbi:MAG: UDP-N-acetylmuramoylalanyl-D-glutamyl-2,6-diaminopimelate--D-alanyl-D-alanine ligase [Alphaproteobacteria bacterium]|nr:UDP-N-acetylmuramoylalanyl-D-glutamyl-2,6-diaminopimelate--D-alanyl-D-alanine ligase [Alphaproteobacteria bacterium]
MTEQARLLWTIDEISAATGGVVEAKIAGGSSLGVASISIDTRTLQPGALFIALKDARDGHEFVPSAFAAGARAALVARDYAATHPDATLIRVEDPFAALQDIARAARARLSSTATVIAVTGSVGKTGTKDMLRCCFSELGETHAADKSYNNHWGVPLTLAATPPDVQTAIYEIGMNHAGEITPLTKLVQPDIAIVTTVEPVHLEFFASVADIAEAKAEIFSGLRPGGVAILNRDNDFYPLLAERAAGAGAKIRSFGKSPEADVRLVDYESTGAGGRVTARIDDHDLSYQLASAGAHVAQNTLAVVAALAEVTSDVGKVVPALAKFGPAAGRGTREVLSVSDGSILIIDESYNANPASMRAALAVLGSTDRKKYPRRIAILGDMLELGDSSRALHADLRAALLASDTDLVFAAGPNMEALFQCLPQTKRGAWAERVEGIETAVVRALQAGDVVMVKGSLGSRMARVLAAIRKEFAA